MTKNKTSKDEVFRKIGRNVVALQKMEGMLKKLVTLQGATISVDDREAFDRRSAAISKRPLGHLVSEFLRSAYASESGIDAIDETESRATISLSFKLDPEMKQEHGESLSAVVSERNALIHQMLISFDPNSVSSRDTLATELDEQLERIRPEYRLLHSLLAAIKESFEEVDSQFDIGQASDKS